MNAARKTKIGLKKYLNQRDNFNQSQMRIRAIVKKPVREILFTKTVNANSAAKMVYLGTKSLRPVRIFANPIRSGILKPQNVSTDALRINYGKVKNASKGVKKEKS